MVQQLNAIPCVNIFTCTYSMDDALYEQFQAKFKDLKVCYILLSVVERYVDVTMYSFMTSNVQIDVLNLDDIKSDEAKEVAVCVVSLSMCYVVYDFCEPM